HALNRELAGAPAELRDLVLADPRVQAWLDEAAALVTGPLGPYLDDPDQVNRRDYPEDMLAAIRSLEQASNQLSPDLAAALVKASLPAFAEVNDTVFRGFGMFGGGVAKQDSALDQLVRVASHASGAGGERALLGRIIDLAGADADWGRAADAVTAHDGNIPELARSIGPALFIELELRGIDVGQGSPV